MKPFALRKLQSIYNFLDQQAPPTFGEDIVSRRLQDNLRSCGPMLLEKNYNACQENCLKLGAHCLKQLSCALCDASVH